MASEITSPSNPRVKELVALRKRRERDRTGRMVVEGRDELLLALEAGARPEAVYHCPELAAGADPELHAMAELADAPVVLLSRAAFEKASYRQGPDGWLAVIPALAADLAGLQPGSAPLVLVVEGVEKPGNLGAILRTADAAGVAAVIAADPVTDWGNPNLVRASKGAVFSVPVAAASTDEVLDWLAERDITVVAATPEAEHAPSDVDLTGPVAVAVGAEDVGLSAPWLTQAGLTVRIPMFGRVDSLNVATSAAIIAYEAVRQRKR